MLNECVRVMDPSRLELMRYPCNALPRSDRWMDESSPRSSGEKMSGAALEIVRDSSLISVACQSWEAAIIENRVPRCCAPSVAVEDTGYSMSAGRV